MKKIFQSMQYWLGVLAAGLALGLFIQAARAWVEPGPLPPSSNIGAPINTGGSSQIKIGALGLGTTSSPGTFVVYGSSSAAIFQGAICIDNDCRYSWPSGGDNLGNHTATTTLNMNGQSINSTNAISANTLYDPSGDLWIEAEDDVQIKLDRNNNDSNRYFAIRDSGGTWRFLAYEQGQIYVRNRLYTPIMYDYNNTNYYVDPASTNRLNYIRANRIRTDNINLDGNEMRFYYSTDSIIRKTGGYLELHGSVNGNSRMWLQDNVDRIYIGDGNTDLRLRGTVREVDAIYAGAFYYSSDGRLKKNIDKIDNSLEQIKELEGVSFQWRDEELGQDNNLGLIAQDVEDIFPEAVDTNEETGLKSVQYGNLVAPIIEAIKELAAKVDDLFDNYLDQQRQIDELRQEIEELKKAQ